MGTYVLRLLVCAAALPLPFAGAARMISSLESSSSLFSLAGAFCFVGGGGGSFTISTSESDSDFFTAGGAFAARFFATGIISSSSSPSSSSSSDADFLMTGAFGRARELPAAGAMAVAAGLRGALAAAAAAFLFGMKSSSPPESSPNPPRPRLPDPPPIDLRVLSVACFRLTFLPLESTTPLSSHSAHAFCAEF